MVSRLKAVYGVEPNENRIKHGCTAIVFLRKGGYGICRVSRRGGKVLFFIPADLGAYESFKTGWKVAMVGNGLLLFDRMIS